MENTIIETVISASAFLQECNLDMEKISQEETIIHLNNFFNTTTIETVLLVSIFQLSAESNQVDREDLARYFNCNPILFFKYENNFKNLLQRKLIQDPFNKGLRGFQSRKSYKVSDAVLYAVVEGKAIEIPEIKQKTDPIELLTDLAKIINEREENDIETSHLVNAFLTYLNEYKHISLFNNIHNLDFRLYEKLCFVLLIEQNLNGRLEVDVDSIGDKIFSKKSEKIHFCTSLHNESNELILNKWISFSQGGYFSNARVRLTRKSKEFLIPLGIEIRLEEVDHTQLLIAPQAIEKKKLYYNPPEAKQVATVANSIGNRNYSKIKKRLLQHGLRTGICILLYGDPGTGKTETVYQIAKQTGRSVWKVDLTDLKSMWFGESQKKVKALFDNYKSMCQKENTTPILLLNEADAILGTRTDAENGAQATNNAIQNIFLDCLEDFEGILFATTNLEQSLDSAFERRFLFKIKFERPQAEAQKQIWKAMLRELTPEQAKTLSENYNLSGGEIENVLRKLAMVRVLEKEVDVFENVKLLCKNEQVGWKGKRQKVGFII